MAYEEILQSISLNSAIDWTDPANQYRPVAVNAQGEATLAIDTTACIGIVQIGADVGQAVTVGVSGITKALAGAAVAPGDLIQVSATSTLEPGATLGSQIGVALTAADVDEYFTLLLQV